MSFHEAAAYTRATRKPCAYCCFGKWWVTYWNWDCDRLANAAHADLLERRLMPEDRRVMLLEVIAETRAAPGR